MVLSLVGAFGGFRSSVCSVAFARRGGWSRPLPLGAPRPCLHPPFSLLEARAALQAKATRLRRNFIIATVPADSVGEQAKAKAKAKANLNLFSP